MKRSDSWKVYNQAVKVRVVNCDTYKNKYLSNIDSSYALDSSIGESKHFDEQCWWGQNSNWRPGTSIEYIIYPPTPYTFLEAKLIHTLPTTNPCFSSQIHQ